MRHMARRRKKYRRAGLKVWVAALFLVGVLFAWGGDDPRLKSIMINIAGTFLPFSPVIDMLRGGVDVIDGDTLQLGSKRIRLHGIDAPESAQTCRKGFRAWACGAEATRALQGLIGISAVKCEKRNIDRYGRVVATCHAGRTNMNAWMVRNGWAVAYRQYGGAAYAADELVARRKRAGVWAGRFVMPWDWRKGKR